MITDGMANLTNVALQLAAASSNNNASAALLSALNATSAIAVNISLYGNNGGVMNGTKLVDLRINGRWRKDAVKLDRNPLLLHLYSKK
jgi:hypothetical protein